MNKFFILVLVVLSALMSACNSDTQPCANACGITAPRVEAEKDVINFLMGDKQPEGLLGDTFLFAPIGLLAILRRKLVDVRFTLHGIKFATAFVMPLVLVVVFFSTITVLVLAMVVDVSAGSHLPFHRYNPVGCKPYTYSMVTNSYALELTHSGCEGTGESIPAEIVPMCPTGTTPLFTSEGRLLNGALYQSSRKWVVNSVDGFLAAEGEDSTLTINMPVYIDSVIFFDNDPENETGLIVNGIAMPITSESQWGTFKIGTMVNSITITSVDSAHVNFCVPAGTAGGNVGLYLSGFIFLTFRIGRGKKEYHATVSSYAYSGKNLWLYIWGEDGTCGYVPNGKVIAASESILEHAAVSEETEKAIRLWNN